MMGFWFKILVILSLNYAIAHGWKFALGVDTPLYAVIWSLGLLK